HTHTHTHTDTNAYSHTHTYTYTHTHTHIHKHIHPHTHTARDSAHTSAGCYTHKLLEHSSLFSAPPHFRSSTHFKAPPITSSHLLSTQEHPYSRHVSPYLTSKGHFES